ncbi:MAG TPA: hypothetical protein VFQ53_37910 [Kofleriaceae bacterium]|nr:hypothetical protein [Kofleriaceae bacterium]
MWRVWAIVLALAACDSSVRETFRSGERLKLQLWEHDGRRIPVSGNGLLPLFDEARQEACSPAGYLDDPTIQCLPEAHTRGVYRDAACTQHAALRPHPALACDPCYALTDDPSLPLLRLTGPSASTTYYERRGATCAGPYEGILDDALALAANEFVPLQLTEPSGDGPVQWRYIESADGLHVIAAGGYAPATQRTCDWEIRDDGVAICWDGGTQQMYATVTPGSTDGRLRLYRSDDELLPFLIFDSSLAVGCSFKPAYDGTWRCVPDRTRDFGYAYSDAMCTTPNEVIVAALGNLPSIPIGWSQDGHMWTTQPTGISYGFNLFGQCTALVVGGDIPTGYLSPSSDVTDDYVGVTVEIDH